MTSISLIAATFYGNRGAEAMLCATIAHLQKHANEPLNFHIFSYYPERDRQLVTEENIQIHSAKPFYLAFYFFPLAILYRIFGFLCLKMIQQVFPDAIKALAGSKMLICLAGVSFVGGRIKFIPYNIATIFPAMVLGIPVIKFAQALGPFHEMINKHTARFFLKRCHQIFARGENTLSHLTKLFPNPLQRQHIQRANDIAFLFEPQSCLSQEGPETTHLLQILKDEHQRGKKIIGICPSIVVAKRAQKQGYNYAAQISELITILVEKGFFIALYPNATRGEDMDKTHNNDLPLLLEIQDKLPSEIKEYVIAFSGSINAKQIHEIINHCDMHLISRFHAMIASLNSAIPVLVIGWSHKYREVMELFQQEDMMIDYKEGDLAGVLQKLYQLIEEYEVRKEVIQQALPSVRSLSMAQLHYALNLLERNSRASI